MTRIRDDLLQRLMSETDKGERQVYRLIEKKGQQLSLPRHLAALALAMERGINVNRFASPEDLAEIRGARFGTTGGTTVPRATPPPVPQPTVRPRKKELRVAKKRGTSVFVVHGRNEKLRRALFAFLRSVGLHPLEWRKALELTGKPSPYVGEVLDAALNKVAAVVVLLTPDDEARLKQEFVKAADVTHEGELKGQPRANVLFEAGMAFGRHPDKTVLVQVGEVRPFSDIGGRHLVHLNNSVEKRQELITKLQACGCDVDDSGSDWVSEGDFTI